MADFDKTSALVKQYNNGTPDEKQDAAAELLKDHQAFITSIIAKSYPTYRQQNYDDLQQCGVLGFMKSLSSYDESKGALTTYCSHFIKHELSEYVSKQLSNMTIHYAATLRKINRAIHKLQNEGVQKISIPLLVLETGLNENRIGVALSVAQSSTRVDDTQNLLNTNYADAQNMSPMEFVEKSELTDLLTAAFEKYCTRQETEALKWKLKLAYTSYSERMMAKAMRITPDELKELIQSGLRGLKKNKHLKRMFERYEREEQFFDESDTLVFINDEENQQLMHDLLFDEEA